MIWHTLIHTYLRVRSNGSKMFIFNQNGEYYSNVGQSIVRRKDVLREIGIMRTVAITQNGKIHLESIRLAKASQIYLPPKVNDVTQIFVDTFDVWNGTLATIASFVARQISLRNAAWRLK